MNTETWALVPVEATREMMRIGAAERARHPGNMNPPTTPEPTP